MLVFHAYNVDALVNKATDGNGNDAQPKLDWSEFGAHGTDYTGLNIDAALGELNGTSLGDLNTGVDVAVGGGVALDVLNGVLVVKGDFSIALGQLSSAALPSGATQDADAMVLTLTNVGVFVGVGGSLSDANNTPNNYSDDEVLDGTLGFGATVSKLTLVSLKDRGATAAKTDDRTYLGVALQDFDGNLVGLDDVLVFHAYNVDALVNKATDGNGNDAQPKLDWSEFGAHGTDYTGLNIDAALGELNGTSLGDLDTGVDVAVGGGVALDVLNGVLVVKGDFSIALGQLSSAALPSGATQDADALVLTLTNVGVFVGVGGSLSDTTDGEANNTPNDYSDDEVLDGTLGFGATVSKLTLVSLKDRGATAAKTDDRTYLGVALQGFDGNLVGLDDVLVFHAYNVDALVNKATDGNGNDAQPKLDWSEFGAHGTDYTGLNIDAALGELNGTSLGDLNTGVDVAVGGGVALDVLNGVLVVKGDFSIALGQLSSAALPSGATQDADALVLTLTNVGVFVGVGGSLSDTRERTTPRTTTATTRCWTARSGLGRR